MIDTSPIDEGAFMNIELDYYHSLFDGRLCPSPKDLEAEGKKRKDYPFHSMWELFVFALIIGMKSDKRIPIEKTYKPFRWQNIANNHQKNILILVISKSNSLEILREKEELKKIVEEYANGGLMLINQELKNNPAAYNSLEKLTYMLVNEIVNN